MSALVDLVIVYAWLLSVITVGCIWFGVMFATMWANR